MILLDVPHVATNHFWRSIVSPSFVSRDEFEDQLAQLRRRLQLVEEVANLSSLTAAQAARDCELLYHQQRRLWQMLRPLLSAAHIEQLDREHRAGVVESVAGDDVRDSVVGGVELGAQDLVEATRSRMSALAAALDARVEPDHLIRVPAVARVEQHCDLGLNVLSDALDRAVVASAELLDSGRADRDLLPATSEAELRRRYDKFLG